MKEVIGDAVLYLGDCSDVLCSAGKGGLRCDALVTDPPYGIGEARGKNASRGNLAPAVDYGIDNWDDRTADAALGLAMAKTTYWIVFGGNYYDLGPAKCWLVWDKENGATDFADAELAWTNLDMAVRLKRYMWNGMLRANKERRGDHPTQKPVGVMEWCLSYLPSAGSVMDPFMGSGTTGVACMNQGKRFVGIEREPKYFEIACERIEQAQKQRRLFE